jgi:hypothetical protein
LLRVGVLPREGMLYVPSAVFRPNLRWLSFRVFRLGGETHPFHLI